ncbi:G5 domain-containing protein [Microbacterium sp. SORGH_AS_0888]|uniref:G5 domain-containing protein n=1 Tax=Microbacterium sp. SORGH_AS_0888 TaxID=3041791 RepID=UPI00278B096E|nr:G5 domain-containing protein [Microbacterium sp. SORGH_AS_0888]MDQ1131183.1 hypothetical protein [Microbacterium sp. SORGH_AS_0888]
MRRYAATLGVALVFMLAGCGSTAGAPVVAIRSSPSTESATPSPLHTPVRVVEQIVQTEPVAFERVSVDDPSRPRGSSAVTTPGVAGVRSKTFEVTRVDGVETSRTLVKDEVTTAPVTEVTAVGTYVAPPPEPEPDVAQAGSGCDPNYADGCVPIASDVDCAGGSGNGPAYFSGTARVVGRDVYGLDRDGDGIACE